MTQPAEIDLDAIKIKFPLPMDIPTEVGLDLIAAVEALREQVAVLRGCETLDCPECGETTHTNLSGCGVCGAHLSLLNFNTHIKQIDADWRRSTKAAGAHAVELAGALENVNEQLREVFMQDDWEADCLSIFEKIRTALASTPPHALERARAKDEVVQQAAHSMNYLRIEPSNGRILVSNGRGWDKAAKSLRKALQSLDALDPAEQEDGT